jgi:hypothetical protein
MTTAAINLGTIMFNPALLRLDMQAYLVKTDDARL